MAETAATDGSFRWEDLDQRLISPKLSELAEEMQKRVAKAPGSIAFETAKSGNSARYVPQFLEFHEQLADEWVAKTYVVHCDAWNQQGRALCAPLIRDIRDRVVTPMLSARTSSVKFELSLYFTRTGHADTGSLDEWSRRMDRLAKRWQGKLEADAVACEYEELKRRRPELGFWQGLQDKFNTLSMEEREILKSHQTGSLRYPLSMSIVFESEDAEWGMCSLSGGASEGVRTCFELEATRAGVAIGKQPGRTGLDVWLHHVFNDCTKHKSELLFAPIPGKRGIVERVCEASSIACTRLERELAETDVTNEKGMAKSRRRVLPPPVIPLPTGSIHMTPEAPTQVPTDLPPHYPSAIRLETMVQLGEATKAFRERSQLELLCRDIVSRLTPILCEAVKQGKLKGDIALEDMKDLIHYVCAANCESCHERFRIENVVINSDKWHEMLKQLAACEAKRHNSTKEIRASDHIPRRQRIEAFIQKMLADGHRINKKDIWLVAGYKDPTEFERFQREDARATAGSIAKFNRVLNMSPDRFIETLAKQRSK